MNSREFKTFYHILRAAKNPSSPSNEEGRLAPLAWKIQWRYSWQIQQVASSKAWWNQEKMTSCIRESLQIAENTSWISFIPHIKKK